MHTMHDLLLLIIRIFHDVEQSESGSVKLPLATTFIVLDAGSLEPALFLAMHVYVCVSRKLLRFNSDSCSDIPSISSSVKRQRFKQEQYNKL